MLIRHRALERAAGSESNGAALSAHYTSFARERNDTFILFDAP
jgi:hypothetical protein